MYMYYTKLLTQYQFFSLFYELVNYHKISNGMFIFVHFSTNWSYITKLAMKCPFLFIFLQIGPHIIKLAMKCPTFFHFPQSWLYYKITNKISDFFLFYTSILFLYKKKSKENLRWYCIIRYIIYCLMLQMYLLFLINYPFDFSMQQNMSYFKSNKKKLNQRVYIFLGNSC